jgi:putative transposase
MLNTRKIAEEYRLTHWAGIMQERASSGLNIKEYCKQIGVCQNTYFYWQRRVRAAACQELSVMAKNEIIQSSKDSIVPSGWAVCETVESEISEKPITIEIGKFRIAAAPDVDSEHLSKVCRALLSLC